jgi:hypothetical protein
MNNSVASVINQPDRTIFRNSPPDKSEPVMIRAGRALLRQPVRVNWTPHFPSGKLSEPGGVAALANRS